MFFLFESYNKEFHLSILEALLINKFKPEFYKRKLFYTPVLFCNPPEAREINSARPNSLMVRKDYSFFFLNRLFPSFLHCR